MDYPNGTFRAPGRTPGQGRQASAFSLAELMIALVILGLGLLFIAAALPVGLEYTRQTVDLANADAAGEYALEQLELNLRTAGDRLYDPVVDAALTASRLDMIHRPRDYQAVVGLEYPLAPKYEPFIKVWPLSMGNVRFEPPSGANATREIADNVDDVNSAIRTYLLAAGFTVPTGSTSWPLEAGFGYQSVLPRLCSAANQVLPGLARVYPPIEPITSFSVEGFFNGSDNDDFSTYAPRFYINIMTSGEMDRERMKALDRRVAWTVFYRRVAYDEPGEPPGPGLPPEFEAPGAPSENDVLHDPLLYEIIVVVTQRVSINHRFPRQDLTTGPTAFETPQAYNPNSAPADDDVFGTDRLAPTPWLVAFDSGASGPALPLLETFGTSLYVGNDRTILANSSFEDPPTLTFRCTPQVGALLPVGSIFIPALNDNYRRIPGQWAVLPRLTGFVPHAPHTLPIYEVVERPDANTVVVKNNGYYPWVVSSTATDTLGWPVWVIPPAFVERAPDPDTGTMQPVYERTSPILKVIRRTVTLHEINR